MPHMQASDIHTLLSRPVDSLLKPPFTSLARLSFSYRCHISLRMQLTETFSMRTRLRRLASSTAVR